MDRPLTIDSAFGMRPGSPRVVKFVPQRGFWEEAPASGVERHLPAHRVDVE